MKNQMQDPEPISYGGRFKCSSQEVQNMVGLFTKEIKGTKWDGSNILDDDEYVIEQQRVLYNRKVASFNVAFLSTHYKVYFIEKYKSSGTLDAIVLISSRHAKPYTELWDFLQDYKGISNS